MKTNLSNLMSLVSEEERLLHNNMQKINDSTHNVIIKELNGTENVIENNTDDFNEAMNEFNKRLDKIIEYKNIIFLDLLVQSKDQLKLLKKMESMY